MCPGEKYHFVVQNWRWCVWHYVHNIVYGSLLTFNMTARGTGWLILIAMVMFFCVRLMVTVLKQDTVAELKAAICELLGRSIERELLVTAEVKGGCISRPLVSYCPCTHQLLTQQLHSVVSRETALLWSNWCSPRERSYTALRWSPSLSWLLVSRERIHGLPPQLITTHPPLLVPSHRVRMIQASMHLGANRSSVAVEMIKVW